MSQLHEFTCCKCGGNKLIYQKWVQSNEAVTIDQNGHIAYGQPNLNPDIELGACQGYRCRDCGRSLNYYGSIISTEKELIMYLMLDQDERDEDERMYQEMVQEQVEKEIACGFTLLRK